MLYLHYKQEIEQIQASIIYNEDESWFGTVEKIFFQRISEDNAVQSGWRSARKYNQHIIHAAKGCPCLPLLEIDTGCFQLLHYQLHSL